MIKEAIEKIMDLTPDKIVEIHGRPYWSKTGLPVKEPKGEQLPCQCSLSSLVSALQDIGDQSMISKTFRMIVAGPKLVSLVSRVDEFWGERLTVISAKYENNGFVFGRYHDLEEFIIGVQCQFVDTPEKADLLSYVSSITGEEVINNTDDGISQTVSAKVGFRKETKTRNPIVLLRPYRTFSEIEQPLTSFLLRVQKGNLGPQVALFEADGGQWKEQACKNIASWLRENAEIKRLGIPVIG